MRSVELLQNVLVAAFPGLALVATPALGAAVAVTFELLPQRVDLIGFVLQGAGLGGLLATAFAAVRRPSPSERGRWIERGNAFGAALFLGGFILIALTERVL
jgi:hypothetical protein